MLEKLQVDQSKRTGQWLKYLKSNMKLEYTKKKHFKIKNNFYDLVGYYTFWESKKMKKNIFIIIESAKKTWL